MNRFILFNLFRPTIFIDSSSNCVICSETQSILFKLDNRSNFKNGLTLGDPL